MVLLIVFQVSNFVSFWISLCLENWYRIRRTVALRWQVWEFFEDNVLKIRNEGYVALRKMWKKWSMVSIRIKRYTSLWVSDACLSTSCRSGRIWEKETMNLWHWRHLSLKAVNRWFVSTRLRFVDLKENWVQVLTLCYKMWIKLLRQVELEGHTWYETTSCTYTKCNEGQVLWRD